MMSQMCLHPNMDSAFCSTYYFVPFPYDYLLCNGRLRLVYHTCQSTESTACLFQIGLRLVSTQCF